MRRMKKLKKQSPDFQKGYIEALKDYNEILDENNINLEEINKDSLEKAESD